MDNLIEKMLRRIDDTQERLSQISGQIWNLAETGGKEFESSALLMDELEREGFSVQRDLVGKSPDGAEPCDMPTAFKAVFENGDGPSVGVMLEYDALPNGHSCGHNLIAAAGLGAALGLRAILEDVPGRIVAMGTPAEEGGAPGKTELLRAGYFDGLDAVMMVHPSDRWNAKSRFLSVVHPKNGGIAYRGRAAHASSEPERGRSALDAVLLFCQGVEFMREHIRDGARMHYSIVSGGDAPNIVPDFAKVNIYVRAERASELDDMKRRVTDIARGAAMMTDTTLELAWDSGWYAPVGVPSFCALAEQSAKEIGIGRENFLDYEAFGSTDAGNVGLEFPLVHLDFKIAPLGTNWHSGDSAEAARSEEGFRSMIAASKVMALSLFRLLTDAEIRGKICGEFEMGKKQSV